jgi:hypothetical protein
MGFLKKIFKPVSKVLDKIVPNEAKPFLPYLSAFAPMIAPGIMGAFGNTMMSRALMGGGLNLASQLAQEGNEGDVNWLSTALAGGIGALSAPQTDTRAFFENTVRPDSVGFDGTQYGAKASELAESTMLDKGRNVLADAGIKSADFLSKGIASPLSKEGLYTMAGMGSQGLMDTAYNKAKLLERDFERDQTGGDDDDEDANRALAIRQSMEAYGFTEQEIVDAIAAAGYKKGGRVALAFGGIDSAVEQVDDVEMKENIRFAQNMDIPMEDLVEEFIIIHKRKPNNLDELKRFYRDKYENKGPADVKIQETMTERFTAEDGGVASVLPKGKEMDYRGGGMIPMGSKERADDVPARLSKNEFVMTADAVRAAGGGSVNEGARRMYNLMNNLEARA